MADWRRTCRRCVKSADFLVDCDRKPLTWSTRYARIAFAYFINNFLVSERALSNKRVLLLPGFQSRSPASVLDCSQVSIFSYFYLITAEAVNSILIPLSATFTLTFISTCSCNNPPCKGVLRQRELYVLEWTLHGYKNNKRVTWTIRGWF